MTTSSARTGWCFDSMLHQKQISNATHAGAGREWSCLEAQECDCDRQLDRQHHHLQHRQYDHRLWRLQWQDSCSGHRHQLLGRHVRTFCHWRHPRCHTHTYVYPLTSIKSAVQTNPRKGCVHDVVGHQISPWWFSFPTLEIAHHASTNLYHCHGKSYHGTSWPVSVIHLYVEALEIILAIVCNGSASPACPVAQ